MIMEIGARIRRYCRGITYFRLFLGIEIILTAVFLTIDLIWHGGPFSELMLSMLTRYKDFFIHYGFASAPFGTNIYEFSNMACFPPLAYLLYGFLARLGGYYADDPADMSSHDYVGHNMTVFLLYNIFCIVLLVYACSLYIKKKGFVNQVLFPSLLIFSYPIAFSSIQRGNSVLLVAPLIAIALAWRNDESKVKREFAMILIAICAGLKIYPAVLGLLYLKEKRWGEAVRLVIYGAVLFFVPFVFFGGFEGIKSFFGIVFALYGEVTDCSVNGFVLSLVEGIFGRNAALFATIVQQLYLVFSLIAFFCVKNKRSEVLVLCCLMTVYISSGNMYTCIYLLPALLMFFAEHDDRPIRIRRNSIPDILAFVMFLFTFSRPFAIGNYNFIYDSIIIIAMVYNLVVIGAFVYRKVLSVS